MPFCCKCSQMRWTSSTWRYGRNPNYGIQGNPAPCYCEQFQGKGYFRCILPQTVLHTYLINQLGISGIYQGLHPATHMGLCSTLCSKKLGVQNWLMGMAHALGLSNGTSFLPLQFVRHCLKFYFYQKNLCSKTLCVQCYICSEKHWGGQRSKMYACTPSSLFVRHCIKFDFYKKNKYLFYVQSYLGKNLGGVKGSKIDLQ